MSASMILHTEFAHRRAEVEADDGVLWIRVDDNVVSWTPHTLEQVSAMRKALDEIEAYLVAAMQEAA